LRGAALAESVQHAFEDAQDRKHNTESISVKGLMTQMSVYVDSMEARFGRMVMCHMVADTSDELNAMADRIGVDRKWIQHPGEPTEHYDVAKSKRALAVKAGAIEISTRELALLIRRKRKTADV
jgi:hypothetical protein